MRAQLPQPSLAVLEALALRDVIHKQGADGAAVVGSCDGTVALLPCCVPDLRLDGLAIMLDLPRREFDAYCGLGILRKLILGEPG